MLTREDFLAYCETIAAIEENDAAQQMTVVELCKLCSDSMCFTVVTDTVERPVHCVKFVKEK